MTPRGAIPNDLAQWRRHVDMQLRRLAALASYRPGLRVDLGDFNVSGGGNIVVSDGGGIDINDGGNLTLNEAGEIIIRDEGAIRWYDDAGNPRVYIGQMYWIGGPNDGDPAGKGLLIEQANGEDLAMISEARTWLQAPGAAGGNQAYLNLEVEEAEFSGPGDSGWLWFPRNSEDSLSLRRGNGEPLFDAFQGSDGPQLTLWRWDGSEIFNTGQTWFRWRHNGDLMLTLGKGGGGNTYIHGGNAGANATRSRITIVGGSGERLVRVQDGAGNTHIPIVCSEAREVSSGKFKNIVSDADRAGALAEVKATRIRRWRYKPEFAGQDAPFPESDEGAPKVAARLEPWPEPIGPQPLPDPGSLRLRTGPIAEDAPDSIVAADDETLAVNLGDSIFTLWAAVQELTGEVDKLRARVDELEAGEAVSAG